MAAPTDAGYGEAVELDKGATGLGLSAEDPIGFDEKNGSENEEDVQVAKKPRVEAKTRTAATTENGAAEDVDAGYGVESVEGGFPEKDIDELDPLLAHNGGEGRIINGEGGDEDDDDDEEENGGLGAAEDDVDDDAAGAGAVTATAPGKDAAGDVGLRTLLQEGDTTKTPTSLLNGAAEDASHMLNGAK